MTGQPAVDEHVRAACHRLADLTEPTIGLPAEDAQHGFLLALATVFQEISERHDQIEAARIVDELVRIVHRELGDAGGKAPSTPEATS